MLSNDDLNESKLPHNGMKPILKEHSYFHASALFYGLKYEKLKKYLVKTNTAQCKFSFRHDFTPLWSIQRRNYVRKEHPLSTFWHWQSPIFSESQLFYLTPKLCYATTLLPEALCCQSVRRSIVNTSCKRNYSCGIAFFRFDKTK